LPPGGKYLPAVGPGPPDPASAWEQALFRPRPRRARAKGPFPAAGRAGLVKKNARRA